MSNTKYFTDSQIEIINAVKTKLLVIEKRMINKKPILTKVVEIKDLLTKLLKEYGFTDDEIFGLYLKDPICDFISFTDWKFYNEYSLEDKEDE